MSSTSTMLPVSLSVIAADLFYYHNGGQLMTRHKTTTVKLNLEEIELLQWALYRLNRSCLEQRQLEDLERIDDRLSRAEDRVL